MRKPHAAFEYGGYGSRLRNAKVVGFSTGPYLRRASPRRYQVRARLAHNPLVWRRMLLMIAALAWNLKTC